MVGPNKFPQFSLVVAHDSMLGIGRNGALPWSIAHEMQHFRTLTSSVMDPTRKNVVLMGRKTWESIPSQNRPLKGRLNLILSRDQSFDVSAPALICHSWNESLERMQSLPVETCFVIGGASVFGLALQDKRFNLIHVTEVVGDFNCDVFFPEYREAFVKEEQSALQEKNGYTYRFSVLRRKYTGAD